MPGYIIGFIIGFLLFLFQLFKPSSAGFRYLSIILFIAFSIAIYHAKLGGWNVLVFPVGSFLICVISAFIFPYAGKSAKEEYALVNPRDYYSELADDEKIGKIDVPYFKQTYDRIIIGLLTEMVTNHNDLQRLGSILYSKNFYPISEHTKHEIMQHIRFAIRETALNSNHGEYILEKSNAYIKDIFNAYVSVMSIHEEAKRFVDESN